VDNMGRRTNRKELGAAIQLQNTMTKVVPPKRAIRYLTESIISIHDR
jgi:hypothetical protein